MPKHKAKKKSRGDVYAKEEPVNRFENDGSFMDMFKKMAEQSQQTQIMYQQQYGLQYSDSESKGESSVQETVNELDSDQPYSAPQAVTYKSGSGPEIRSQQVNMTCVFILKLNDSTLCMLSEIRLFNSW